MPQPTPPTHNAPPPPHKYNNPPLPTGQPQYPTNPVGVPPPTMTGYGITNTPGAPTSYPPPPPPGGGAQQPGMVMNCCGKLGVFFLALIQRLL